MIGEGRQGRGTRPDPGPEPDDQQVAGPGLAGNVVQVPSDIGVKQGSLVVKACAAKQLNPCKVGYLYDIKASALDIAIRKGYRARVKGHNEIKQVAEGETFFTPAKGLAAAQTMLQSQPGHQSHRRPDQGSRVQPASSAKKVDARRLRRQRRGEGRHPVRRAGTAASWQVPATEGRLGRRVCHQGSEDRQGCGAHVPNLPLRIVTKANAEQVQGRVARLAASSALPAWARVPMQEASSSPRRSARNGGRMAARINEWIEAYGRAWEERDADAAAALFADDAVYKRPSARAASSGLGGRAQVLVRRDRDAE